MRLMVGYTVYIEHHASGEGERVIAPEPWEGTLVSRRAEEGLSRSFPG